MSRMKKFFVFVKNGKDCHECVVTNVSLFAENPKKFDKLNFFQTNLIFECFPILCMLVFALVKFFVMLVVTEKTLTNHRGEISSK